MSSNIDAQLTKYGESLNPSKEFHEEGRRLAQQVFRKLQELLPREFSLAEPRFAGSFGKSTGVIQSDLDLYIVLNNRRPPFDDILDYVEKIILQHQDELEIKRGTVKQSQSVPKVSMQFTFRNDMEVDLLPAAKMEREDVLAEIAKDPENNYYKYNNSLIVDQLAFMKSQDSFTHTLIRLSKCWLKSLNFGAKKFAGGSTIMELIGCAAAADANEGCTGGRRSMLQAFARVINMVCKMDTLKVAFQRVGDTKWRRVPKRELEMKGSAFIPNVVGTRDILNRRCFIMEPANPYFDQLYRRDPANIDKIKEFARVTKQRLEGLKNGHYVAFNPSTNANDEVDIKKLFEPQPTSLVKTFPAAIPGDFLIGYAYSYSSLFPDMKVRDEDMFKDPEVKLFVEAMKWKLLFVVNSATTGNGNAGRSTSTVGTVAANSVTTGNTGRSPSTHDVKKAVQNLIKTSLGTGLVETSKENHGDYHVTLTVPYSIDDVVYAVKCSFLWK